LLGADNVDELADLQLVSGLPIDKALANSIGNSSVSDLIADSKDFSALQRL